jgi:hypothetical protein
MWAFSVPPEGLTPHAGPSLNRSTGALFNARSSPAPLRDPLMAGLFVSPPWLALQAGPTLKDSTGAFLNAQSSPAPLKTPNT